MHWNHCDYPLVVCSKVTSAEDNKNRRQLTERRWTLRPPSRRTRPKNGQRSFPPRSTRTARPELPLENTRRTLVSTIVSSFFSCPWGHFQITGAWSPTLGQQVSCPRAPFSFNRRGSRGFSSCYRAYYILAPRFLFRVFALGLAIKDMYSEIKINLRFSIGVAHSIRQKQVCLSQSTFCLH